MHTHYNKLCTCYWSKSEKQKMFDIRREMPPCWSLSFFAELMPISRYTNVLFSSLFMRKAIFILFIIGFNSYHQRQSHSGRAVKATKTFTALVLFPLRTTTLTWNGLPADMWCVGGLPIHAWIIMLVRMGASSTSESWTSPYDPEGVGAAEIPVNKMKPTTENVSLC